MPSDLGHKMRTTIDKGSKVRRTLLPPRQPESVSPARFKIRHIAASRTNRAKYDPIGAGNKQQDDEKQHLQLNKEYRICQLRELGIPMLCELRDGSADPDDM